MKKISEIQNSLSLSEQIDGNQLIELKGGMRRDDKRRQRPGGGTTTTSPSGYLRNSGHSGGLIFNF